MKIVSFVIHGNAITTLERCLKSLKPSSDAIVCVDSCSTDGSLDLSKSFAHVVQKPWAGYGAARAKAMEVVKTLSPDVVFFLDSDEWLLNPDSLREMAEKSVQPKAYRVTRNNMVTVNETSYCFFQDKRVRLFAPQLAQWTDKQIVHEAFPNGTYELVDLTVMHDFLSDTHPTNERAKKAKRYAALWAIEADSKKKRGKNGQLQKWATVFKYAFLKGALLRGGQHAFQLARWQGDYASYKYEFLERIKKGEFETWQGLYASNQLEKLMTEVAQFFERD
jgi:glycosyltransferase involved in cell wall biosynthesis